MDERHILSFDSGRRLLGDVRDDADGGAMKYLTAADSIRLQNEFCTGIPRRCVAL